VLRVVRIEECVHEAGVSGRPSTVLGWARPLPGNTPWQCLTDRLERQLPLDLDEMFPTVAKVVLVGTRRALVSDDLVERDAAVVDGSRGVFLVRLAQTDVSDLEYVEMTVGPAHRGLEDVMEAGQRYVLRHQETAPDRRRYVDQAYPQVEDVIRLPEPEGPTTRRIMGGLVHCVPILQDESWSAGQQDRARLPRIPAASPGQGTLAEAVKS